MKPKFLNRIFPKLYPKNVSGGDFLYGQGEVAEDVYFIIKGNFVLYIDLSAVL